MDDRINVCLLNDSFPPVIDGVANAVLNYAKIIQRDFGSALVVTPRYPGKQDEYPFPVLRYPSIKTPKIPDYRMGVPPPNIIRGIKKHPVDIIHCHCPFISSMIAKTLRQSTKAPLIMTYHTKYDIDIAHSFDSEIMRIAAKKFIVSIIETCDEVWAVSRGAGENLKSLGYQGEYLVMDNGVDFPKGPVPEETAVSAGKEFGLPGDPSDVPIFLYIGRMMWYKNLRLTLEGLHKAKAEGAMFKMVFVGGGEESDEVTALANELELGGECIFTGPIRDREKLRALYSRADMLLFPSTFDSAPLAVREAAACGLAGVLVRGSASAEPVTDEKNAVLIDEDPACLASAVTALSKNREYMKDLGRRALDELYLSWDTVVSGVVTRYREILERTTSSQ